MDRTKLAPSVGIVKRIHRSTNSVSKEFIKQLREMRAVELGADELVARGEWCFRSRPRALRNLRRAYCKFCSLLLEKLERAE